MRDTRESRDGGGADGFDRTLRDALEGYRPDVPAEAMWDAIEAERRERRRPPPFRRGPLPALLAAAGIAAVAFGLGRLTAPGGDPATAGRTVVSAPGPAARAAAPEASPFPGPWAVSAADHFREAESLLLLFRTEDGGDFQGRTSRWARSLLGTTRLLLDSPAAADPRMAEALGDLELVLVQIASLEPGAARAERRFVEESLAEHDVMTKIRAAAEGTAPPLTAEDMQ